MKDLNYKLIVPTFDAKKNVPKIYDNFSGQDDDENLWEVVRKSCSAPSYFPAYKNFIDGGVIANNPSLVSFNAISNKLKVPHREIEIMNIGTGVKNGIENVGKMNNWYRWEWIQPMLKMLTSGNEVLADFTLNQLPVKKYIRFNPVQLEKNWSFDDPKNIDKCIEKSSKHLQSFLDIYDEFFKN